jgi:pyrroline-5-carboxylate reductase
MIGRDVGFIGGGRIVAALLQRLQACCWPLEGLRVSDIDLTARTTLLARFAGIEVGQDNRKVAERPFVFIALHPAQMSDALPEIRPYLQPTTTVVSLAPFHSFARLEGLLGGFTQLVRMAPNAPSLVGAGYNPISYSPAIAADVRAELEAFLSQFGAHPTVDERSLEAYAILTALGPTYFWFQWQALRDLGRSFGLRPAEVDAGLSAMLDGARRMMFDADLSAGAIRDVISTAPLKNDEAQIVAVFRDRLTALYQKYADDLPTLVKHRSSL